MPGFPFRFGRYFPLPELVAIGSESFDVKVNAFES
jgi:hypothetical protein